MIKYNLRISAAIITAAFAYGAHAAISADEAKQLGTTLTAWGAEKAGNKDGTIPAYTGEPVKSPANFNPKNPGRQPDPFNEKPLFSITAQNYTKYADKLDGHAEMFKRYPNYRMDIYPSHRSWVYPKFVVDNTLKNATACKAINNEQTLDGCYGGYPFPIPKTGAEAMWNHLLQFEGRSTEAILSNYITSSSGQAVLQVLAQLNQKTAFFDPNRTTPWPSNTTFLHLRVSNIGPARQAGGSTVLIDPLDWTQGGRRAYQYIPGQRRVKLAPDLAYDTPSPYSGGGQTMDDQKGFMGALDRWDFKLVGKKEKYIPYNNYAMFNSNICADDKIWNTKNFANPDCMRWELHRVWHIEATLKPGFRHVYKKRVFFWDEDAPGAGTSEGYDASGKLYRLISTLSMPFYTAPGGVGGVAGSAFISSDLITGIAGSGGTTACPEKECGYMVTGDKPDSFFQPDAMAGAGVR